MNQGVFFSKYHSLRREKIRSNIHQLFSTIQSALRRTSREAQRVNVVSLLTTYAKGRAS